jgi:hypothetical protein
MKKLVFILLVLFWIKADLLLAQELVMVTSKKTAEIKEETPANTTASVFEFTIYSKIENEKNIAPELYGTHFLGDEIAKKMYLLDKTYVFETELAPGNPATTTTIRKPLIYKSVKKIEAYLKKSLRKKELSTAQATDQFNKVLEVAINIIYQGTDSFENQLRILENPADLLDLYTKRVHLNFVK